MNEIIEKEQIEVENMIYEIRGKQVMFDSDLAKLYQVETKRINEAVKNNLEKFPERFAFRIDENEYNCLKSKFSTSKGGARKGHTVFTEQGVAMLATILKSKSAINVSISIMDAFVTMRHLISNKLLSNTIEYKLLEHDKRISLLEVTFNNFEEKNNHIFFEGQIYDAYSKIIDIMKSASKGLIIIDAYADKMVLDMISKIPINVILITRKNKLLTEMDINKYNSQYHNLRVVYNNTFHDRYFILDSKIVYHSRHIFKPYRRKDIFYKQIRR